MAYNLFYMCQGNNSSTFNNLFIVNKKLNILYNTDLKEENRIK